MPQVIESQRFADGWHTIIDGVIGAKISKDSIAALAHGDKVARGLCVWETQTASSMKDLQRRGHSNEDWNMRQSALNGPKVIR